LKNATMFESLWFIFIYKLQNFLNAPGISVCDQPLRSTQLVHPFLGRRTEYQPQGGDALQLGSKGRYGSCVRGR